MLSNESDCLPREIAPEAAPELGPELGPELAPEPTSDQRFSRLEHLAGRGWGAQYIYWQMLFGPDAGEFH